MATAKQENHLQTIKNDPFMKWAFRIVISILIVVLFVILFKMLSGRYVNIFGLEVNKKNADTMYVQKPIIVPTAEPEKENIKKPASPQVVYVPLPSKNTNNKQKDTTPKITAKNVNTGTNSGIVGDVTVNNGRPVRALTEEYKRRFLNRLSDTLKAHGLSKDVSIRFGSTMGSDESFEFTKIVIGFLRSIGFSNIDNNVSPTINANLIISFDGNRVFIDVGVNQ